MTLREVIMRRYVHHLVNGTVAQEIERMQRETEKMTKKKTETAIEPGETADIGTHVVTNTSEQAVYVGEAEAAHRSLVEEAPESKAMVDSKYWDVEYVPGPGTDISAQNAEAMRYVPRFENGVTPAGLIEERLRNAVVDLIDKQHARAASGGGTATHWQNAQAHIRKAIESIERQAADDAEMAKTPASDLPST